MSHPLRFPRWIVDAGFGLALAVVLPVAFHRLGLGPALLPMHLPVLLTGALAGPGAGSLVGVLAPAASHFATGMPPIIPPVAPLMTVELTAYGFVAGTARAALGTPRMRNRISPLALEYAWLVAALLAGRIALGIAAAVAGPALGLSLPAVAYLKGAVLSGLPGLAVQLALIPVLMTHLQRVPRRAL